MTTSTNNNNNNINILTKPMTPFIRFSKDTRKYIKELHPEYNKVEVTKELARLWNNDITKEVKEEYKRRYIIDIEQYNRDKKLGLKKHKKQITTIHQILSRY